MAGFTAAGLTFLYAGFGTSQASVASKEAVAFSGNVTGISVEAPSAVVADMTSVTDPAGYIVMVPTGDWVGGSVTVDFIGHDDPQAIVRTTGALVITSGGMNVARHALCQSASISAQTGEIVRGTLKFLMTDFTGIESTATTTTVTQ
jgi:hypothetical protein